MASSSQDLKAATESGQFRQDLYYRLNVVPITVPTLRDRVQDIPLLADKFSQDLALQNGLQACRFSDAALLAMQAYHWPGNVRQLRNVVEWIMIMTGDRSDNVIETSDLPAEITGVVGSGSSKGRLSVSDFLSYSLREAREIFERDYLQAQIQRFEGNISRTSQFVGMERSALHRKIKMLSVVDGGSEDTEESEDKTTGRKIG